MVQVLDIGFSRDCHWLHKNLVDGRLLHPRKGQNQHAPLPHDVSIPLERQNVGGPGKTYGLRPTKTPTVNQLEGTSNGGFRSHLPRGGADYREVRALLAKRA